MHKLLTTLFMLVLLVVSPVKLLAQDGDVQAKIDDAMSAGPHYIAQDAVILDWTLDDDGNFTVLREGTNGWSCLPGNPKPVCLDEVSLQWMLARMAGEDFETTSPGFAYVLQGDVTLSNTDPFATEPSEDYWESEESYMMVLPPTGTELTGISPDIENPSFIRYPDTPYQHLMLPIQYDAEAQTAQPEIIRISAADAFALAENETGMLIDARYTSSYERSHAAGAVWIPGSEVESQVEGLPKDQVMISYCD